MGSLSLNAIVAGITRLRIKGGASPQALYDLVNGVVTASRTITSRYGTSTFSTLPAGTIGLCTQLGKFHVFSAAPVVMTDPNFVCHTIIHPTDPTKLLTDIFFAEPFVGFIYVSAGFSDGSVRHYWLQTVATWAALTSYTFNGQVIPTAPNGFVYTITNQITAPVWTANTTEALNNIVQPSVYNGLEYKATATTGTPIQTSDKEPKWPKVIGHTVVERRYITNTTPAQPPSDGGGTPTPPEPPANTPGGDWGNRYGPTQV